MTSQVSRLVGRTSLRFKSWLPEYASGKPVVLAGVESASEATSERPRPVRALCMGPGEWLIVSREEEGSNLRERIANDLAEYGLALADVSDELTAVELRGSLARDVLAKGSGLDMHPQRFPVGRCARASLANVDVVIDCVDAGPRFELYFARSRFRYLHSWLSDAAAELELTRFEAPAACVRLP